MGREQLLQKIDATYTEKRLRCYSSSTPRSFRSCSRHDLSKKHEWLRIPDRADIRKHTLQVEGNSHRLLDFNIIIIIRYFMTGRHMPRKILQLPDTRTRIRLT